MIAPLLCALALAGDADQPDEAPAVETPPPAAPAGEPDVAGEPDAAPGDSRDEEIFGSRDEEIFGSTDQVAPADEGEIFGGEANGALGQPLRTDASIAARLDEADRRFEIGGQAWMRANAALTLPDDEPAIQLDNPNFIDLYGDARPNDRIRFYARTRVRHDLTIQEGDLSSFGQELQPTTVLLDQMWLNFDVGHKAFVTLGRQRIKWGVGRLWNPTDFLAPSTLDGLAVFDERTGVGLLKVHIPIEKTGTNLYVLADFEGATAPSEVGGALRLEQLLGPVEVALSGALRKDEPQRLGAQVSLPVGLFDFKGELGLQHGVTSPYWEGELDIDSFTLPTEVSREDDWIPQALGGVELGLRYNDEDTVYVGAEYFYNSAGYDDSSLYPWLLVQSQFTPFYLGKHYVAAYVLLMGPGQLDEHSFTLTGISNLSDRSVVGRFDYSVILLTELRFNAYVQVHGGEPGGEFSFALEVPPIPETLPDGLTIDAPVVDAGVGFRVAF